MKHSLKIALLALPVAMLALADEKANVDPDLPLAPKEEKKNPYLLKSNPPTAIFGIYSDLNRIRWLTVPPDSTKGLDQKKTRIVAIAIAVVWFIMSILLIMKMRWWGLLISALIGLALVAAGYFYIQYKERQIIKYYKQIGMSEEMYIKELRKRNVDKKQIDQVRKTWRKVKADPVVGNIPSTGGSKGNKKK